MVLLKVLLRKFLDKKITILHVALLSNAAGSWCGSVTIKSGIDLPASIPFFAPTYFLKLYSRYKKTQKSHYTKKLYFFLAVILIIMNHKLVWTLLL